MDIKNIYDAVIFVSAALSIKDALVEAVSKKTPLRGADLTGAYLTGAYLRGAKNIPPVLIQPEVGGFFAWKKLRDPKTQAALIAKLWIPAEAQRTNSYVSRKCRADYVEVVEIVDQETGAAVGSGVSPTCDAAQRLVYTVGQAVKADTYDPDFRVDCSGGLHYLMTRQEAEEWERL